MPERPVRRRLVRMLGSLPLVAEFARRLQIARIIERECPLRGNAHLTHAQVALAILANRLTQPKAMYHLLTWARKWAVRETFGLDPERLNDDRLARCLDALAEHIDPIQGAVTLAAVREFDLDLSQLHWDLTSVVLRGDYPPEEQQAAYPAPAFGYGGEAGCQQLRVGELVSADGAVPVWHRSLDGNQADVGTVVATMEALREQVSLPECLVVGDSRLLSAEVSRKLRAQDVYFLAPLPRSEELDAAFLALPEEGWQPLEYLSQREAKRPPAERTGYLGQEVPWVYTDPKSGRQECFRRLFVISSEERAACWKVRAGRLLKAAEDLRRVLAGLGRGQLRTKAQVEQRVAKVLEKRHATAFFRVTIRQRDGKPDLTWELDIAAVERARRFDGYYVLLTSWPRERADASALLCRWKGEWQVERRFSDWKGPLRLRPVFVTSNRRMAALILLLHLALMIYCLLEREARRALARSGRAKVSRLLAGHVEAVPTGANILAAFEHLFLLVEEDEQGRSHHLSDFFPEQESLWRLLDIKTPTWH